MDVFFAEDWWLRVRPDSRLSPARFECEVHPFLGRKGRRPTAIAYKERVAALRQRLRADGRRGRQSEILSSALEGEQWN